MALGADLALPGALLAGVIRRAGHQGRAEGMYFGWWNFATKLNLALAAGIALPLLGLFGYAPGSRDASALAALTLAYCALPCVLKLCRGGAAVLRAGCAARRDRPNETLVPGRRRGAAAERLRGAAASTTTRPRSRCST